MKYLCVFSSSIISGILAWLFLDSKITDRLCPRKIEKVDVLNGEIDSDVEKENLFARWTLSKQLHIILTVIIMTIAWGSNYQLFTIVKDPLNIVKMLTAIWGVIAAGCIDLREKRIPNLITGLMAVLGIIFLGIGVLLGQDGAIAYISSSFFAAIVSAIVLLIVSILTRQGIGYGDIKLICAIAIIGGVNIVIGTLLFASILSAIVALFLVLVKRMNAKGSIPFGPFIMFGCLITIIMMQF